MGKPRRPTVAIVGRSPTALQTTVAQKPFKPLLISGAAPCQLKPGLDGIRAARPVMEYRNQKCTTRTQACGALALGARRMRNGWPFHRSGNRHSPLFDHVEDARRSSGYLDLLAGTTLSSARLAQPRDKPKILAALRLESKPIWYARIALLATTRCRSPYPVHGTQAPHPVC